MFRTYTISAPVNSKGTVTGMELGWQQPLAWGFGIQTNFTYADSEEDRDCHPTASDPCIKDLVGASKDLNQLGVYTLPGCRPPAGSDRRSGRG